MEEKFIQQAVNAEGEQFGKSARVAYIVMYAIIIPISLLFFVGFGAFLIVLAEGSEYSYIGIILIVAGVILAGLSIFWLVYFIKMPPYTVTYKDGILNFRNKVQCTPAELDSYETKSFGVDGAMFGFGKLIVNINGKIYKFGYVRDVESVVQKLYVIKVQYSVQQNIAKRNAEAANTEATATEADTKESDGAVTEENDG